MKYVILLERITVLCCNIWKIRSHFLAENMGELQQKEQTKMVVVDKLIINP